MKIIVTCGSPWTDFQSIESLLTANGMQTAAPPKKDASYTIQKWHDEAFKLYCKNITAAISPLPIKPSKPWEQMATEIFTANLDNPIWGWGNAKSTWFLDFWLEFDPNFRFLLAYTSPENELAKLILSDTAANEFIQTWLSYNRVLLNFYKKHPDRSALINYGTVKQSPTTFKQICEKKLGINLTEIPSAVTEQPDELAEFLAQQIVDSFKETKELFAELEAAASGTRHKPKEQRRFLGSKLKKPIVESHIENKPFLNLIGQYRELRKDARLLFDVQNNNAQLSEEKIGLENAIININQTLAQLQQQIAENQEQIQTQNQLKQLLSETEIHYQNLYQETLKANELILIELHQTQEMVEIFFSANQALEINNQQLLESHDGLKQQIDYLNSILNESQQSNEMLLSELHQTQENVEYYFSENLTIQTNHEKIAESWQEQIEQFKKDNQHLTETNCLLEQQINDSHSVQNEIEQANVSLLLELNQAHENIENYFAKNQAIVSQLQRLYARYPDWHDYAAIEVSHIENKENLHSIKWKIDDFLLNDRHIPLLTFKTTNNNGVIGISFEQKDNDQISLPSWSLYPKGETEIFIPLVSQNKNSSHIVAASDWRMLKSILIITQDTLKQDTALPPETHLKINASKWLTDISKMHEAYLATPHIFRFDNVDLYKQYVNPDYEHLWFTFKNVWFGNNFWPDFQFRLSAAAIRPGKFSQHPKLEFPLSDEKTLPFENWFVEIHDAVGERMELRFALAPPAIDIQMWNTFSPNDQALIASILDCLPSILELIEYRGNRIARPYRDWQALVSDMQNVFKLLIRESL